MTDIFATIDAAIGCQQCEGPIGDSVSDDFCSSVCQQAWHTDRTEQLVSYREPYDLRSFNPDPMRWAPPTEFRLPPSSSDLRADWRAARTAFAAAETPEQHAAVVVRMESLAERQTVVDRERAEQSARVFIHFIDEMTPRLREVSAQITAMFRGMSEAMATIGASLNQLTPTKIDDPRAAALAARRQRNTGPTRGGRAPKTIGRPSSMRR